MASSKTKGDALDNESEITLGLLNVVQDNSGMTQRSMANELGIALGMANAYIKRCIRKGFIKVRQIPSNRYAYYLTPTGFSEKSRLTAEYLTSSLTFFRRARSQCAEGLGYAAARGWRKVALAGISDLAEIATLCAFENEAQIVGIIDPAAEEDLFADLTVVADLEALGNVDAILITDLAKPQETFDRLLNIMPKDRLITPQLLGVTRDAPVLAEDT